MPTDLVRAGSSTLLRGGSLVDAREKRCPLWALAAPGVYLLAALLAVRSVLVDRIDVGVAGILLAAGLLPAFVIPAIFATRSATLRMSDDGLSIDGRLVKVDDAKLDRAERGSGTLRLSMRGGQTRTFLVPSYKEALQLLAMLPPVSAPSLDASTSITA